MTVYSTPYYMLLLIIVIVISYNIMVRYISGIYAVLSDPYHISSVSAIIYTIRTIGIT